MKAGWTRAYEKEYDLMIQVGKVCLANNEKKNGCNFRKVLN
jgi:hypothetical protein